MQRIARTGRYLPALCALLCFANAHAGDILQLRTFKVNATSDGVDANPGDGICNAKTDPNSPPKCTLRAAVMEGNTFGDGWKIEIDLVPGNTYSLTIPGAAEHLSKTGDLDVVRPMRIGVLSAATQRARIDAGGLDRALHFGAASGGSVLHGAEIIGGEEFRGAAVFSAANALTIEWSDFHDNARTSDHSAVIQLDAGTLKLRRSWIHQNGDSNGDNFAVAAKVGDGGALYVESSTINANYGTGIHAAGGASLDVLNSTISGNAFSGMWIDGADAIVRSSTLIGNGTKSSGFFQLQVLSQNGQPASLDLRNSVVDGASACELYGPAGMITFHTQWNIYSNQSCVSDTFADNSLHNTPALLSELGDWGGPTPTPTHMPLPGSPAIDRAPGSLCAPDGTDQRGLPRPVAHTGNVEPRCDTGAVELEAQDVAEPWVPEVFADGFEDGV